MRLHVSISALLAVSAVTATAYAAPPEFTGDVDRDFAGTPAAVRVADPGGQELSFENRVSGLDLDALVLWHDPATDVLHVGFATHGVAGDVDGDGNPGLTSPELAALDGLDLPDFGGGESFALLLDLDDDGEADVIAGVPGTGGLGAFQVARVNGPFPPFAFGQELPGHAGNLVGDTGRDAPHVEFTVERFSALPGMPGDGSIGAFRVRGFLGSTEDGPIGDDWVPGQDMDRRICFDTDEDGSTTCAGDCRDGDPNVRPGAEERCDGADDDCDGAVDEDCVSICGDGEQSADEECDDGNLVDGDGCDSDCTRTRCGNGIQTAGERCDDGNRVDGDGCDQNCTLTGCGNGVPTAGEACDDGNAEDGDGCDNNCTETGCGNGVLTDGEQCDDGNLDPGDGCDAACQDECAVETCDGTDDDCDGRVDEGFALGEACDAGRGACAAQGVTVCSDDAQRIVCDAVAGVPAAETCDGVDNDCDGEADEGFDVGDACVVGQGVCAAEGTVQCTPDGEAACNAEAGEPGAEICNELDDDCDGEIDEGEPPNGTVCTAGDGLKGGGCVDCDCRVSGERGPSPGLWILLGVLAVIRPRRRR